MKINYMGRQFTMPQAKLSQFTKKYHSMLKGELGFDNLGHTRMFFIFYDRWL